MTAEQEAMLVAEAHRLVIAYKRAERSFDRMEITARMCRDRKLKARNRYLNTLKILFNAANASLP